MKSFLAAIVFILQLLSVNAFAEMVKQRICILPFSYAGDATLSYIKEYLINSLETEIFQSENLKYIDLKNDPPIDPVKLAKANEADLKKYLHRISFDHSTEGVVTGKVDVRANKLKVLIMVYDTLSDNIITKENEIDIGENLLNDIHLFFAELLGDIEAAFPEKDLDEINDIKLAKEKQYGGMTRTNSEIRPNIGFGINSISLNYSDGSGTVKTLNSNIAFYTGVVLRFNEFQFDGNVELSLSDSFISTVTFQTNMGYWLFDYVLKLGLSFQVAYYDFLIYSVNGTRLSYGLTSEFAPTKDHQFAITVMLNIDAAVNIAFFYRFLMSDAFSIDARFSVNSYKFPFPSLFLESLYSSILLAVNYGFSI